MKKSAAKIDKTWALNLKIRTYKPQIFRNLAGSEELFYNLAPNKTLGLWGKMKICIGLCGVLAIALIGCSPAKEDNSSEPSTDSEVIFKSQTLIMVTDALPEQCSAGGKVYSIYSDANENRTMDSNESPASVQVVCNGTNGVDGKNGADGKKGEPGIDGYSTEFNLARVTVDSNICPAQTGVQLSSGLDLDRSGRLEPSEMKATEILCDGADGALGQAGPAGADGHGIVFQVAPASESACAAGGSIILMATDISNRGSYSSVDPNQQSVTLCNGIAGAAAPPSAYTPVDAIRPCGNTVSYKEILLRLSNGEVLAAVSDNANGLNTRLSFIPDGTYINTDGSNCVFSLATNSERTLRSISWQGQTQQSWALTP